MSERKWEPLDEERLLDIIRDTAAATTLTWRHDVYRLACEVNECRDVLRQLVAMRQPLPGGWTAKIKALLERITGEPT